MARPKQPLSVNTLEKHSRLEHADVTHSVCPYCAVGCSTNIYTKGPQVIDIEENPESPINEGTLCPKGANVFQLIAPTCFSSPTALCGAPTNPSLEGATMKALCWHGKGDVRIDTVPDPKIQDPRDAIIRVTSTAICGSDLHLYDGRKRPD